MDIIIANHQRLFRVDRLRIKKIVNLMIKHIPEGLKNKVIHTELSILFVNDKLIKEMNSSYRGKDKVTDVLSFPQISFNSDELTAGCEPVFMASEQLPLLGDVVINTYQAARQAEEYGVTIDREIARLLTHGFLHLIGYDHEVGIDEAKRMKAMESKIVRKLATLT